MGEVKNRERFVKMVQIMCFLKLKIGITEDVMKKLIEIPQVKQIDIITGEYDLVALLEAESGEELHHLFAEKIEKIPGIESSNSHLIMLRWNR
jgi:DNA-binding Lrp family transcriptional regulator